MYGPYRMLRRGNHSLKTVGIVAKRRSVQFGVYNVRLLSALDKLLRDKPRYIGELSTSINDALLAVDLNTVELDASIQTETNRERNASRHLESPAQADSSSRQEAELFDE